MSIAPAPQREVTITRNAAPPWWNPFAFRIHEETTSLEPHSCHARLTNLDAHVLRLGDTHVLGYGGLRQSPVVSLLWVTVRARGSATGLRTMFTPHPLGFLVTAFFGVFGPLRLATQGAWVVGFLWASLWDGMTLVGRYRHRAAPELILARAYAACGVASPTPDAVSESTEQARAPSLSPPIE